MMVFGFTFQCDPLGKLDELHFMLGAIARIVGFILTKHAQVFRSEISLGILNNKGKSHLFEFRFNDQKIDVLDFNISRFDSARINGFRMSSLILKMLLKLFLIFRCRKNFKASPLLLQKILKLLGINNGHRPKLRCRVHLNFGEVGGRAD